MTRSAAAAALLACLLLPAALVPAAGAAGAAQPKQLSTQLATLAQQGDAVQLWRAATETAAAAVVKALEERGGGSVELQDVNMDELRIWHGQSVTLGLRADRQPMKFVVQSEPEWRKLADVLPAAQGGLLPESDWDSLDRDWLSPVSRGSLLPDFAVEGPLDVYLSQPTALALYLPHASDAGVVRRVLLRQGAAVVVRGARAVRLRRGLDLPPISLGEFAAIVTSDAEQQQPQGVLHLLQGVQREASKHWNETHPESSLGYVALELDLAPGGAALLAAPTAGGGARRLRARPAGKGAIELLPRDGAPQAQPDGRAVALPGQAAAAALDGPWPLPSVHPTHLKSYERLLRQVISSRLFKTSPARGGGGGQASQPELRVAQDVQLRLTETEAEATTLLQMQLDLVRWPDGAAGASGSSSKGGGGKARAGGSGGVAGGLEQQKQQQQGQQQQQQGQPVQEAAAGKSLQAAMQQPPDPFAVAATAASRLGPHETWSATVQIKGDAQRGNLRFVPLVLQRVGAAHDTVQLAPSSLLPLFGGGRNGTDEEVILA